MRQIMDVTEMSLYHGLGILLISQICSSCIPVQCLSCNITDDNDTNCFNEVPGNCTHKDFQVSLNSSCGFALDEGVSITMDCTHNLPPLPLEFTWKKDAHTLEGRNASSLTLKAFTIDQGQYTCGIQSPCGYFSSLPQDFQVSLNSSGGFALDEGDSITMNCTHNLPPLPLELPLEFTWKKDAHTLEGRNASSLTLTKVFTIDEGQYTCGIQSRCGIFSSLPQKVTVATNSAVILIVCGLSAVFLVVCLGLAMKYKLKMETAQNRRRKLQLQQNQRGPEMRPRDA